LGWTRPKSWIALTARAAPEPVGVECEIPCARRTQVEVLECPRDWERAEKSLRLLRRERYPMKEPQTWVRAIMLIIIAAVADALANAGVEGVRCD
jgi:hypothetical protein